MSIKFRGVALRRLFGPADAVFFAAPDYPGASGRPLHRAARTPNLPPATPGMLALTAAEVAEIERLRAQRLTPEIVAYLRKVAGTRLAHVSDSTLQGEVRSWIGSGSAQGLRTVPGYKKWCFLQLYTGGRMSEAPGLSRHLARSRQMYGTPDKGLDEIMSLSSQMLRPRA